MLGEKDLAKPLKHGLDIINNMNLILSYLYTGETYFFKGYYYRMDGELNPYIVSLKKNGEPKDKGTEDFPIFQNEYFWNLLIEMATKISSEDIEKLKVHRAEVSTLYLNNTGRQL